MNSGARQGFLEVPEELGDTGSPEVWKLALSLGPRSSVQENASFEQPLRAASGFV